MATTLSLPKLGDAVTLADGTMAVVDYRYLDLKSRSIVYELESVNDSTITRVSHRFFAETE